MTRNGFVGDSLADQWLGLSTLTAIAWIQSLVGEKKETERMKWICVCGVLWPAGYMCSSVPTNTALKSPRLYLAVLSHSCGSTQNPDGSQRASLPPLVSSAKILTFLRCCNDNGVQPVPWISQERKLIQNKTSCQYFN